MRGFVSQCSGACVLHSVCGSPLLFPLSASVLLRFCHSDAPKGLPFALLSVFVFSHFRTLRCLACTEVHAACCRVAGCLCLLFCRPHARSVCTFYELPGRPFSPVAQLRDARVLSIYSALPFSLISFPQPQRAAAPERSCLRPHSPHKRGAHTGWQQQRWQRDSC